MESENKPEKTENEKAPTPPPPPPPNPDRFLPHTLEEAERFISIGPSGYGC
jgi:hypothetical protein